MNRRQFVQLTGMGMASTTLMANALANAEYALGSGNRVALKKAVKFGMIEEDMTILQKFELLKSLGFDGVEMDSPSDLDVDEVVAARDTAGLPIHGVVDSVHWRQTLSDADPAVREAGLDGLKIALNDAHAFGASTVLLVPAVVNRDVSYDDAYSRSQTEIRKVLPMANELGVKIAIENVWNRFLLSPLEAARYVDEFESDMIGWYMDVGNIVTFSWPEQWIRILGHRVLKLDIKEYSRAKRDEEGPYAGFRVALGEGDCNWPEVLNALDEIGYEGWATAEIPGGDTERLTEIATRMNRILELD
ncbi:MAG: sugar phosphate isomerase/epimerase [Bacteroidetes bacterium]|nr:sugar phosphate isomerase/epimerase [Bacteroidota bacterium]